MLDKAIDPDAMVMAQNSGQPSIRYSRTLKMTGDEGRFVRALADEIVAQLENGTKISKEIARRIRSGYLTLRLYAGGTATTTMAFWSYDDPRILHLNIDQVRRDPGGRYRARGAASTVVHEGIHSMGGGELTAHIGQAMFLMQAFPKAAKRVTAGIFLEQADAPGLRTVHRDLMMTYGRALLRKDMVIMLMFIHDTLNYAANVIQLSTRARMSRWVQQQGGWARVLGITDPGYKAAEYLYSKRLREGMLDELDSQGKTVRRHGMP
jgi:hypothetical protein